MVYCGHGPRPTSRPRTPLRRPEPNHLSGRPLGRPAEAPVCHRGDRTMKLSRWLIVSALVLNASDLAAQSSRVIDGPEAPVAPAVITRDDNGKVTIRAIKLETPLHLDGKLDEEVYQREQSFGGFVQVVPRYGAEQSERTEVWVMYDTRNMYVACRCWDSAPPDKWIANELRRDTNQLRQNDQIGVMFDTFYDRRSGF